MESGGTCQNELEPQVRICVRLGGEGLVEELKSIFLLFDPDLRPRERATGGFLEIKNVGYEVGGAMLDRLGRGLKVDEVTFDGPEVLYCKLG